MIAVSLTAVFSGNSHAALTQLEKFVYDGDGQGAVMNGRDGGFGFFTPWLDGDADFEIYESGSLHYPSGSRLAGTEFGGHLNAVFPGNDGNTVGSDLQEGVRDLHETDAEDTIGWNRDAVTYMSVLVRKATTDESEFEDMVVALDNGTTAIGAQFGISSNDKFFAGISTTAPDEGTKDAVAGTTYLLIAKMEASTTDPDVLSLWVYEEGDTVPLTDPGSGAEITQTVSSGRSLERLRLRYGNFNTGAEFDEIRIGSTWADVATPEPSSLVLLAFSCVGLLLRRRAF